MNTIKAFGYRWFGPLRVFALLFAELLIIHYARHAFNFECHLERYSFCRVARNVLLASYSLSAVFFLLGLFARDALRDLLSDADVRMRPLAANLAGLAILLASLPFLRSELSALAQAAIYAVWAVSAGMALCGTLLMIAPFPRWRAFVSALGWPLPFVMLGGIAAPFVAVQIRPYWYLEILSDLTFRTVTWLLAVWGQAVETQTEAKIIGADGFFVNVAPSCSGVEGLVLTTVFALIYLTLFRHELRFPNAFMILPIALVLSWLLNSFRIAVLVQIGISGHPELAVGGFHSHAGWLMFTLLSLGIVLVTQSTGIFRAEVAEATPVAAPPPFFSDPIVARILPFIVFMGSALLASTFSETPALVYPLRALAMGAVLALVWPYLRSLPWRIDLLAVGAGVFVACYWVVFNPADSKAPPVAEASAVGFVMWVIIRVIGTSLFVPVIEELFFRGYLMDRLAPKEAPRWRILLALVITTATFAVLHDRWIAAAVAGVIFAGLVLRSRNVTDAIVAHAVANALIAAWAIGTGNWAVI